LPAPPDSFSPLIRCRLRAYQYRVMRVKQELA
jgi:hypothetical protein